jgi:hypothetical protein
VADPRYGRGWLLSEPAGQGDRAITDLADCHHPVEQAELQQAPRGPELAEQPHLERGRERDPRREQQRAAARDESAGHLGQGEAGILGGHREIAACHQLEASADGHAADRGHNRHPHGGTQRAMEAADDLADGSAHGADRAQIHPGAEADIARSLEHERADRIVVAGCLDGVRQDRQGRRVECIAHPRTVDRQDPNPVSRLKEHRLISHPRFPSRLSGYSCLAHSASTSKASARAISLRCAGNCCCSETS